MRLQTLSPLLAIVATALMGSFAGGAAEVPPLPVHWVRLADTAAKQSARPGRVIAWPAAWPGTAPVAHPNPTPPDYLEWVLPTANATTPPCPTQAASSQSSDVDSKARQTRLCLTCPQGQYGPDPRLLQVLADTCLREQVEALAWRPPPPGTQPEAPWAAYEDAVRALQHAARRLGYRGRYFVYEPLTRLARVSADPNGDAPLPVLWAQRLVLQQHLGLTTVWEAADPCHAVELLGQVRRDAPIVTLLQLLAEGEPGDPDVALPAEGPPVACYGFALPGAGPGSGFQLVLWSAAPLPSARPATVSLLLHNVRAGRVYLVDLFTGQPRELPFEEQAEGVLIPAVPLSREPVFVRATGTVFVGHLNRSNP